MANRSQFTEIESTEFSIKANLASSAEVFVSIISNESSVRSIANLIDGNKISADVVLRRIRALSKLDIAYEYENPNDVSLATYLWVLSKFKREIGKILAKEVLRDCRQIWWAKQMALNILTEPVEAKTETANDPSEPTYAWAIKFPYFDVVSIPRTNVPYSWVRYRFLLKSIDDFRDQFETQYKNDDAEMSPGGRIVSGVAGISLPGLVSSSESKHLPTEIKWIH